MSYHRLAVMPDSDSTPRTIYKYIRLLYAHVLALACNWSSVHSQARHPSQQLDTLYLHSSHTDESRCRERENTYTLPRPCRSGRLAPPVCSPRQLDAARSKTRPRPARAAPTATPAAPATCAPCGRRAVRPPSASSAPSSAPRVAPAGPPPLGALLTLRSRSSSRSSCHLRTPHGIHRPPSASPRMGGSHHGGLSVARL